ncbi:MAG: Ig-like domain-containing protein [Spirochaetia bacterium]|nr:Ig-like domain-containing protein [Spirochaetia bacterium]
MKRTTLALSMALFLASCSTSTLSLSLSPGDNTQIRKGSSQTFQISGKSPDYDPASDLFDWTSSDTNIAVISNAKGTSATVTGVKAGNVSISAKSRKYTSVVPSAKVEILPYSNYYVAISLLAGGGYGGTTNVSYLPDSQMFITGGLYWYYSANSYLITMPTASTYQFKLLNDALAANYKVINTNTSKTNVLTLSSSVTTNISAGQVILITVTGNSLGSTTDSNAYQIQITKL